MKRLPAIKFKLPTRFLVVMLVFGLLAALAVYDFYTSPPGMQSSASPTISVPAAGKTGPPQIGRELFTQYMEYYKTGKVDRRSRLQSYEILKLDVTETRSDGFGCSVTFSVLPAAGVTDWSSGNGVLRSDGWIEKKTYLFSVKQVQGNYFLGNMNTVP